MKKYVLVLVALLWFSGYSRAESVAVLTDATEMLALGRSQLVFLEDPSDQLSINNFITNHSPAFIPPPADTLNLGHTASSIWARFAVQDTQSSSSEQTWLLELGYPMLQRVDIFLVSENRVLEQYQIGYAKKMNARQMGHRFFVQPLKLKSGALYQVYINIKRENGSVQMPLKLYRPAAFLSSELKANYVFGLFFGIMIAMIIYNLYLFASIGDRAYLYYILYITSVSLAFLTTTGYGYLLLWYDYPWINEYSLQVPSCLTGIFGLLFVRHFVELKQYNPRYDQFAQVAVVVGVALLLIKLATPYFLAQAITLYIAVISTVMPIIAWRCWQQGSRSAGYFLLGWCILLMGSVLYTFSLLALLPSNSITNNAVFVGAAMETLLLSLGLADRINRERKEKYLALEAHHEAMMRLNETEHRLVHRALHNGVTGLPNRTLFRSLIDDAINAGHHKQLSLVLVNFNNFHEFNKTLGHTVGDEILYQISRRTNRMCAHMEGIVRLEQDSNEDRYLAGIEGVTFAFLVADVDSATTLKQAAALLQRVEQPLDYHGLSLDIDATLSIAHYPVHGDNSELLIRNAHIALETAAGSNEKIAEYSREIDPYNERRISLLGELRHAIENNALQLYFQPQLDLANHTVSSAEVLIRWIHPEYGFVPPDEFIPLAERTGVIRALTYWICREAFRFKSELDHLGHDIGLSINISARNLQDPEFKQRVCALAKERNLSLHNIVMELTETAVMTDPDEAMRMMAELHEAGIRLSIDDFGTGYSSLSYLKRLPVDEIKIDRSFVMDLPNNRDDQLLVRTTLSMGHNFSKAVVAEGVEDEATLTLLKEMGCDLAQGYHIARPMPGQDFITWLQRFQASIAVPVQQNCR